MDSPDFFKRDRVLRCGKSPIRRAADAAATAHTIFNIASLERAGPRDLAFLDNKRYAETPRQRMPAHA